MNIEHLTRSQIVLLTLFVSFVSSMATGIVVVTLMQQAPTPITQSITNVVERTIEKVAPVVADKPVKPTVVKDEDLVVAAIERNAKSVVAFKTAGDDGEMHPAGVGVLVSSDGLVITDKSNVGGILMTNVGGAQYVLQVLSSNRDRSLILGRLVPADGKATSTPATTFTPIVFGDPSSLKIGQTALVLGGRDNTMVVPGIVTSLDTHTGTKLDIKILDNIGISQRPSHTSNGAPIITLDGVAVGFVSIDDLSGAQAGIPVFEARDLIAAYQQSLIAIPRGAR